jgi:hypothetical protein
MQSRARLFVPSKKLKNRTIFNISHSTDSQFKESSELGIKNEQYRRLLVIELLRDLLSIRSNIGQFPFMVYFSAHIEKILIIDWVCVSFAKIKDRSVFVVLSRKFQIR